MTNEEGVVKYQLDYHKSAALHAALINELNAWRAILYKLQLVGRDEHRYGGYGYGNLSCRYQRHGEEFIITGTQTSHIAETSAEHYVLVKQSDAAHNKLIAEGPVKPSSEALTHGTVYQSDPDIQFVFHAHSPHIWSRAAVLDIPSTGLNVAYGTPEMAHEIQQLIRDPAVKAQSIISMAGHQDGIIAFGSTAEHTGLTLVKYLSRALQN
ncbi:MAG: class II aldolase/adducin family protein [Gammaproteobacteria bacterium]